MNSLLPQLSAAGRRLACVNPFPGVNREPTALRWQSAVIVLLLPALWLYPTLNHHLLEPDEGRYAQIAREMWASGDWVVPTLQGKPYLDKPPLMYWLTALSLAVFGPSPAAARLVPTVTVHLTIGLTYLLGRKLVGERAAFRGSVLLALMPGYVGMGRLVILDGLLTLWVVTGWLSGLPFRGERGASTPWLLLLSAACALGTLTKGPIALILIVPPLLVAGAIGGNQFAAIRRRDWAVVAAAVLVVNLPWYAAILARQPGFGGHFFWQHNFQRFFDPFDHIRPFWFFGPILIGGLMPVPLWSWRIGRTLFTNNADAVGRRTPEVAMLLLAGGWCVGFFSLSGCKLPTYILPAFPVLALALAKLMGRWQRSDFALIAGWCGLFAMTAWVGLPWYAEHRSPVRDPDLIRQYCDDCSVPVVCYPRTVDSAAFLLGRDDMANVRSKHTPELIEQMLTRPKTVLLCTHRHTFQSLRAVLPAELRVAEAVSLRRPPTSWFEQIAGETPWGLCDIAVIERVSPKSP